MSIESPLQTSTSAVGGSGYYGGIGGVPVTQSGGAYGGYVSKPQAIGGGGNPATTILFSTGGTPGPNGDQSVSSTTPINGLTAPAANSKTPQAQSPTSGTSWWGSFFNSIPSAIGQTVQGDWNLLSGSKTQSAMGAASYVSNNAVVSAGGAAGAVQASLDATLPAVGTTVRNAATLLSGSTLVILVVLLGATAYLIGSGNIKKVIPV